MFLFFLDFDLCSLTLFAFLFLSLSLTEAMSNLFLNREQTCSMSWAMCSDSVCIFSICAILATRKAISLLAHFFGSRLSPYNSIFLFESLFFSSFIVFIVIFMWSNARWLLLTSSIFTSSGNSIYRVQFIFSFGMLPFLYEETTCSSFSILHSIAQRNFLCPFK